MAHWRAIDILSSKENPTGCGPNRERSKEPLVMYLKLLQVLKQ